MSLTQAEERMLQQLRDDVDRLIANGRAPSREAFGKDDGATRIQATKVAHGFVRGNGVYLDDADNTWKKINGTTFVYADYLWGIVSLVKGANQFTVIVNGEVRIPGAVLIPGYPYEFNASGVLTEAAANIIVKATERSRVMIGASSGGGGSSEVTVDINQSAHGFTVGTFLYRDDTTGLHAKTDNTDPLKCDVRGFVSNVIDPNSFTLKLEGWKTVVSGSTGTLYLSTNGGLTATAPTTGAVIPILYPVERGGTFDGYFTSVHFPRKDNEIIVTQTSHGFVAGNVLRGGGTSWAKAQADTISNARVSGIVTRVISADVFVVATSGAIDYSASPGVLYYLSAITPGAVNANTPPSPGYSVPVFVGVSSTKASIVIGEPTYRVQVGDTSQPGSLKVFSTFGEAISLDASLVSALGKKLYVREWTLCEGATTKKCLILSSDTYTV